MGNKYKVALTTGLPAASRAQLGELGCGVTLPLRAHHPKGLKDHKARAGGHGSLARPSTKLGTKCPGTALVEPLALPPRARCPGALGLNLGLAHVHTFLSGPVADTAGAQ